MKKSILSIIHVGVSLFVQANFVIRLKGNNTPPLKRAPVT